jgi:hypothetical protein
MDVYANAIFKKDIRNQYMQWKAEEIQAERFGSKPSRENVFDWVLKSGLEYQVFLHGADQHSLSLFNQKSS